MDVLINGVAPEQAYFRRSWDGVVKGGWKRGREWASRDRLARPTHLVMPRGGPGGGPGGRGPRGGEAGSPGGGPRVPRGAQGTLGRWGTPRPPG